jgi:PAS domain S-box-containing protein
MNSRKSDQIREDRKIFILCSVFSLIAFQVDISVRWFIGGLVYIFVILLSLYSSNRKYPYFFASLLSALIVISLFMDVPRNELLRLISNRALIIALLWVIPISFLDYRKKMEQKEQEITKSRNLLRAIIDNSPNLIYVISVENILRIANKSFTDFFGLEPESVVGKNLQTFLSPEIFENYVKNCRKVSETKKPYKFEETFNLKGNDITLLTIKFPLFETDGRMYEIGGVSVDITDRKKAENILRKDKDNFADLVTERTSKLVRTEIELEKAKRLSDIGTLAATVAHELRNPLASITLAIANAKRKTDDARIEKNLQTIERKVTESGQIIDNLLTYSRLKPPHFQDLNLSEVLDECGDLAIKRVKQPGEVRIDKDLKPIRNIVIKADPLQIKEVFINLLNNAIDAMDGRKGDVQIIAEDNATNIAVKIKDQGVGIPDDNLERVFETFFSTKAKGTGLGLSVCRQIVDLHNGEITIASKADVGTTVTVVLPK